jgi:predicted RecB family nuclease
MWKRDSDYQFSPSDLIRFFESPYITWMDRYALDSPGEIQPDQDSDELHLIRQKGVEHEREYLGQLRNIGTNVTDLTGAKDGIAETTAAMRRGDEVIYQGYLELGQFGGYPDFLTRVWEPSNLGDWSYEVWDTKLARHPKPYFLVQLCAYAEMLEAIQGIRPRELRVVLGRKDPHDRIVAFRTEDFFYSYRSLKEAFLEQQRHFAPAAPLAIPALQELGRWTGHAFRELEARDDLSLVAASARAKSGSCATRAY